MFEYRLQINKHPQIARGSGHDAVPSEVKPAGNELRETSPHWS